VAFAQSVLDKDWRVYSNKRNAVDACLFVANAAQIRKAHVLAEWMFDTTDGALIVGNAILFACADMARPHMMAQSVKTRKAPRDVRRLRRRRRRHYYHGADPEEQDRATVQRVERWEQALARTLKLATREKDADWTAHDPIELLGHALYTMAFESARLDVRTTWRWMASMLVLCPWGVDQPFHVIPVRDIDVRAKEALVGLMSGRAFTTTSAFTASNTHYASSFRYNAQLNSLLSADHAGGRGRAGLTAAFLLLIAFHFCRFCGEWRSSALPDILSRVVAVATRRARSDSLLHAVFERAVSWVMARHAAFSADSLPALRAAMDAFRAEF